MANFNIMIGNHITNADLSNKTEEKKSKKEEEKVTFLVKILKKIFKK